MKYAKEVIELMAAYPGRDFRMVEIVRYVCPSPKSVKERSSLRKGVLRVVQSLSAAGSVTERSRRVQGGYASYRWNSET